MTPQQHKNLLFVYMYLAGVAQRTDEEEDLVRRIYEVLVPVEPDLVEPTPRQPWHTPVTSPFFVEEGNRMLTELDEVKYMVSLPDTNRPGEFYEVGPFNYSEGVKYLQRWYGPVVAKEAAKVLLVLLPPSGE